MHGMLSFLDLSPEERRARFEPGPAKDTPKHATLEQGTAERGTPEQGTPHLPRTFPNDDPHALGRTVDPPKHAAEDTPKHATSEQGTAERGTTPEQGTPHLPRTFPNDDLQALAALGLTVDPPQLKPALLAQHAHTPGEELLYGKMWGKATPVPGQPCRVLTAGIKKLTALVGLAKPDNCRNNLQGLIAKLAIDDLGVAPNPNHGHVYRVWDQSEILRRRRERGLTHYYRLRRAVVLLNPEIQNGLPSSGTPQNREPDVENGLPPNGTPLLQNGAPKTGKTGYPQTAPLLIRNRKDQEDDVVKQAPSSVVQSLLDVMGECDDQSARRIVAAAHGARPGIPEQVIVQIVSMKGPRIRSNRSLDYPLRVLERAVAETAAGVTGANLCKAWERAAASRADADPDLNRWRREQEAALLDPAVSDQEKRLIRLCLGLNTG
jgi:hypothetical protein